MLKNVFDQLKLKIAAKQFRSINFTALAVYWKIEQMLSDVLFLVVEGIDHYERQLPLFIYE